MSHQESPDLRNKTKHQTEESRSAFLNNYFPFENPKGELWSTLEAQYWVELERLEGGSIRNIPCLPKTNQPLMLLSETASERVGMYLSCLQLDSTNPDEK